MGQMGDYSMNDLMLMVGACATALSGLIYASQKSKCTEINMCCCKLKRDVKAIIQEQKLEKTGHSGLTPRLENQEEVIDNNNP